MKISVRTSSWIAAVLARAALIGLVLFSTYSIRDRARLIRDNENEQILNRLFTSLRDYDSFGAAIEADSLLRERVRGFAVYGDDLLPLNIWGDAPPAFDEGILRELREENRFGRYSIPDRSSRSVKFIMQTGKRGQPQGGQPTPQPPLPPPAPQPPATDGGRLRDEGRWARQAWFFNALRQSKYFYIDISHPDYWRARGLTDIAQPVSVLLLWVLVGYMRTLYIRNAEYRKRIEAQKNLVVLGTAAGTLAHEIKNPLLSIRLQTGILEKLYRGKGAPEIAIINEEVERLSSLIYRVNDYLREGKGNPSIFNLRELLAEIGNRLHGGDTGDIDIGNITEEGPAGAAMVFADPERIRSVFENLIRNALESGSPPGETAVSLRTSPPGGKAEGSVTVSVRDRGTGVAEADLGRIFDPFFTTKSTGTGIGLSISKRFIEAAGGTISIANRKGGGVEVTVTLPEAKFGPQEEF
ncbi:MAG: sensor histidine kinase [Treponema sp.]|nr:sensor histidine kinase [Treponema sp.]